MKYIEQRIEELEKEVNLLKAKNKLNSTSHYLTNNYPPYNNPNDKDYIYNPSVNLMSEPDLETAFASPWDYSDMVKNPLDTITVKLSSIIDDTLPSCNYTDPSDSPYYHPEYPNILGSWEENANPEDVLKENNYDKMDKDFLVWWSKDNKKTNLEKKIESKFGMIIFKFPVLHHEWEMDGYGYIVESYCFQNSRDLILTNHGVPYKSDIEALNEKLSIYKDIIQKTERAKFLLK